MTIEQKVLDALKWARSLQQQAFVSPHHDRAVGEMWEWLEPLGIRNALEVGCGEPPHLTARMLGEHGIECTTFDCQPCCDVRGDMHDLPFADGSFDLIVSRHSLEHVLIPYLAVMEMRRVSRRYLLAVVPSDTSYKLAFWPDHLYNLSKMGWEVMWLRMRLSILQFREGDFTEDYAITSNCWQDLEWRWLLEKQL